ncbi:glycosyltransferase [Variovorax sp. RT4R15]|uniref:glycosyltransferase n=1 Tax=Variovorax sp. RT4R15 TaxID=3443737 RepID=UPI003F44E8C1
MRIVIDLQGAQSTGSARRGIGRYSSSLARAMAKQAGQHEVVLALNDRFPDMVDEVRSTFDGLIEPHNVRVFHPPAYTGTTSAAGLRASERLYEAFLASLRPDVVHVASLFESLDGAVTSVGQFVSQPTAVTLFDLIPLINSDLYLSHPTARAWYTKKIGSLRRADMCLAISESSRQEGIKYLGFSAERCINVSTAAYEHFRRMDLSKDHIDALRERFGLRKPFVMYTGGIDLRKNIEGLVRAFAKLPPELRKGHQLAIVCATQEESKRALLDLAKAEGLRDGDVVLTGFVSEDDLVSLYNLCALFVFPSWHEGFGLPALEAMHCGAAVIGANTSSLPEVIGREDALFDPRDDQSIAAKMQHALSDLDFRRELIAHGEAQCRKFTWEASAERALDGLEALHNAAKDRPTSVVIRRSNRPRMAYVSPLPPARSGIADYSADLLPELAQHYDIDLITDQPLSCDTVLAAAFPIHDPDWLVENAGSYDRVLYHFGNSALHAYMFDLLAQVPGVVVLHDFFLSGVLSYLEHLGGRTALWQNALYDSHGYPALVTRKRILDRTEVVLQYPCNLAVLQQAIGVVSHSRVSRDLAEQWYGAELASRFEVIPLLRIPSVSKVLNARDVARKRLGLRPDDLLVCCFGVIGPTKLNDRIVEAWRQSLLSADARCRLVFVGENHGGEFGTELSRQIAELPGDRVQMTGWASRDLYQRYLDAADVAVQLRSDSRGETSAAVLDAMNHGVATIVNANGSMADLPPDSVVMLADMFRDEELASAMEALWRDPARRSTVGVRGRQIIATQHSPAKCGQAYFKAIESFAKETRHGRNELTRIVSSFDPLPNSPEGDRELVAVARAISETLPCRRPWRQLLIDLSSSFLADSRANTPSNADVEQVLGKLLEHPPNGWRVEPVYRTADGQQLVYARKLTLELLGCESGGIEDGPVEHHAGDRLILRGEAIAGLDDDALEKRLRIAGVQVDRSEANLLAESLAALLPEGVASGLEHALDAGVATPSQEIESPAARALRSAGINGLERADFNHLLHHLRGQELGQLPQQPECFISVGCAGTWYFNWIQERCRPKRHIGIEYYSPKPDDLPLDVEWIANTAGDMSSIANETGDVLFSGQNIEHLWPHDIVAFLRESHRVLKSDGLLVIDSPNRAITSALNWSHPEHILEFTPDEAKALVEAAGFEVTALRGAWICRDPAKGDMKPLTEMIDDGPWPLARRVEAARRHPEYSFSWWLEARKTDLPPDWVKAQELVDYAFGEAWPERVNRLIPWTSDLVVIDGQEWLMSRGTPGVIMSGPGMPLPAGAYEVTFELRTNGALDFNDWPVAAMNVFFGTGSQLASGIISANELRGGEGSVTLGFTLSDTIFGIQFRVIALGSMLIGCRRRISLKSLSNPTYSAESSIRLPSLLKCTVAA